VLQVAKKESETALLEFRVEKLEESVESIHDRFDKHEDKQERQFNKVYKQLNNIDNHLVELQTEMKWVKKISLSFGAIAGMLGGFVSILTGFKPHF